MLVPGYQRKRGHVPEWQEDIVAFWKSEGRKQTASSCLFGRYSERSVLEYSKRGNLPFSPRPLQSMPNLELFSLICLLLTSASVSMGDKPLFSARARGTASSADEKARIAYCSMVAIYWDDRIMILIQSVKKIVHTSSAALETAIALLISAAPPPYTTRSSTTILRTAQIASWSARLASSTIILLLPRTKMVTARVLAHSSITSILSRVVPKDTSRTMPALPNFSTVKSSKRGTIRPFVAIAISWTP